MDDLILFLLATQKCNMHKQLTGSTPQYWSTNLTSLVLFLLAAPFAWAGYVGVGGEEGKVGKLHHS